MEEKRNEVCAVENRKKFLEAEVDGLRREAKRIVSEVWREVEKLRALEVLLRQR